MPTEKKKTDSKVKRQCSTDQTVSKFMETIRQGKFVLLGEIVPGRTCNLTNVIQTATVQKPYVVAMNIAENPRSRVMTNGLAVATYLQTNLEIETILDVTCRDINRMGLASLLLGAASVGIRNILTLTGDHPMIGDLPHSKPVFDLDSTQLLQLAREMVDGHMIFGKKIEDCEQYPPQFHIGIAANPNTDAPEVELLKIQRKIELGAEFIQTQPIFDLERNEDFFKELKKFGIPVIGGIYPLIDFPTAQNFDQFIPSIRVPSNFLQNLKKAQNQSEFDRLNLDFFQPLIKELKTRGYVAGIHFMAPQYTRIMGQLLESNQ